MLQHRIAGAVAKRIVDLLEAIEIDVEDCERQPRAATFGRTFVQHPVQISAIG